MRRVVVMVHNWSIGGTTSPAAQVLVNVTLWTLCDGLGVDQTTSILCSGMINACTGVGEGLRNRSSKDVRKVVIGLHLVEENKLTNLAKRARQKSSASPLIVKFASFWRQDFAEAFARIASEGKPGV